MTDTIEAALRGTQGPAEAPPPSTRTEHDGEVGDLAIRRTRGGPARIRALIIEEGEEWQRTLASILSDLEIRFDTSDGEEVIGDLLSQGHTARMKALVAYDVDGVLGGLDGVKSTFSQRDLKAAMEVVLDAEFPFEEDAKRSVEEAFGLPLLVLGQAAKALADEVLASVVSVSGASDAGASRGPTSGGRGRPSNSSSDTPTPKTAKSRTRSKKR